MRLLWLQIGITSDETRGIAEEAGVDYIEDRCMEQETHRLGIIKDSTASRDDGAS